MKPRMLDLFSGAGGCGVGYHRAGFDVVGVDLSPQPRYPFEFHRADALEFLAEHGREFDAIHASPPCQAYSVAKNIHGSGYKHPDLIAPIRDLLIAAGKLYVIENVQGAPMHFPAMICGLALGLRVKRHRWFESNVFLFGTTCSRHKSDYAIVFGGGAKGRGKTIGKTAKGGSMIRRPFVCHEAASAAMGIDWMTRDELSQAIPPAYTEWIGRQVIKHAMSKNPSPPEGGDR